MLIQKTIKLILEEQIMRKMRRKMFSVFLKYFNVQGLIYKNKKYSNFIIGRQRRNTPETHTLSWSCRSTRPRDSVWAYG